MIEYYKGITNPYTTRIYLYKYDTTMNHWYLYSNSKWCDTVLNDYNYDNRKPNNFSDLKKLSEEEVFLEIL